MDFGSYLADQVYKYYYDQGVRSRIYREKGNSVCIYDFCFALKTQEKNLEVLIGVLRDININNFKQHLLDVQTEDFWKDYLSIKGERERNKHYLDGAEFICNEGNYIFKAKLLSDAKENICSVVLNFVVKPVILFQDREK